MPSAPQQRRAANANKEKAAKQQAAMEALQEEQRAAAAGHYGQLRVHSSTQVGCTFICCRDRKVLTSVEERPRLSYWQISRSQQT
jgi:hypothetical protein